ncbi:coiled-coil domain-containing protein 186 isoform X2 [Rhipicephalus sanguineus]|uniref:coiled-coil domain-containing protein 186 isoform X2 n=1 Tax=Rhipicephalus sanguineus TaxID=34632 RepID=UPI001892DB8B|nr:coiled-coil domain-containing protein 186 isoform X2 [Rhipicephalus sanguineus]
MESSIIDGSAEADTVSTQATGSCTKNSSAKDYAEPVPPKDGDQPANELPQSHGDQAASQCAAISIDESCLVSASEKPSASECKQTSSNSPQSHNCPLLDAIQEDSVQVPTSPVAPLPEVPALNNDRVQASSSTQSYSRTNNPTRENAASMYKVIPAQSADVGGPAILQISSSRSSPEVRLFTDPCASSESDSSSRHCERLDKKGESGGLTLCRYSSDSHLPRCVRTPTELSSCSQESDDSDALLSELESELEGAEGSDSSKHAWGLQNGSQAGTPRCKRCALNYDLMEKLEQTNFELQQQLRYVSEKTSAREAESMRMLAEARAELLSKNDKLAKLLEMVTKEKDTMVVKYATSEKEVILARRALEDMEKKYREVVKERDQHFSRVRSLNNERARLCSSLDTKLADMAKLQKEQERLKEELSARDIKIKWAQNKLKTEVDAHKETQAKLEQAQLRLRDLREEAEQVRRDCQEMIRRYQESEEIKSVSLDHQLKEKLSELEEQKMEKESQEEVYHVMKQELESLKRKHKMSIDENNSLTMKIHNLEKERLEYEQTLSKLKEKLNSLKQEIVDLNGKLDEKRNVELQLEREREKVMASQQEVERLRQSAAEMQADMEACHLKEGELLEFTERLTTKSVQLQSEHSLLELKAQNLEEQNSKLTQEIAQLKKQNRDLASSLEAEQKQRQQETQLLARKLAEKTKTIEKLTTQVQDAENEQRVMKRRHISSIKELSRELQLTKKRLEQQQDAQGSPRQGSAPEPLGLGSRTSSTASLETLGSGPSQVASNHPTVTFVNAGRATVPPKESRLHAAAVTVLNGSSRSCVGSPGASGASSSGSPEHAQAAPAHLELDKQMLVERIVRLQKTLARRNDKIDFLEEHIKQLLVEMKKKSKIIQNYITREESGALVPTSMDCNKAEISKKGGIMASVYNSHAVDTTMTLELSLEINQKLQAVLEDTLLKNITLKENINTLGEEIARLSRDHRLVDATQCRQK